MEGEGKRVEGAEERKKRRKGMKMEAGKEREMNVQRGGR